MPTYQYACTACGNELEAVQSFSDEPLTECPECAGRLRKVFSTVGVVFKGSGFYRTDSRSGSGDKSEKGKDAPAKETAAKDTSTKETSTTKDTSSTTTTAKTPAPTPTKT